ncbi:MAG: AAA family ATPase, partial [Comamonadaceae bacterium]|nr:AAA family ATPase [Comamonadaceae bacterium]
MDPRTNPYAPGAGAPPPDMTGRDDIIEAASIALDRMRAGLVARSVMLVGLRGVGKTVLLNRLHNEAAAKGFASMMLEAPEKRSLPALLAPNLRAALLKLDRIAAGGDLVKRALRSLGGFVQAMKLKYADIEFG